MANEVSITKSISAPEPIESPFDESNVRDLNAALESLDKRSRVILMIRYGLADGNTYTFKYIASIFGISTNRVSVIHDRAVRKLEDWFARRSDDYKRLTCRRIPWWRREPGGPNWYRPEADTPKVHERRTRTLYDFLAGNQKQGDKHG